ncbi:hypothetical protein LCGC14_1714540 [marine sediment metagenome]|uniref:Uncharacterized protein n=1 Tax=marine sediment metagenome TaxID=412755 RepID=A0A0F9HDZ2_9ZZZZ
MMEKESQKETPKIRIKGTGFRDFKPDLTKNKSNTVRIIGNKNNKIKTESLKSTSNTITIRGNDKSFKNNEKKSYDNSSKIRIKGIKNDSNEIKITSKRIHLRKKSSISQISHQKSIKNNQQTLIPLKSIDKKIDDLLYRNTSQIYRGLNIQDKNKNSAKKEKIGIYSNSNDKNILFLEEEEFIKNSKNYRFSEQDLNNIGKEKNLKLISNYSEYKNIKSILQWECLKCGTKFFSKIVLVKQNICPCPECRKYRNRRPRFNFDIYKEELSYYVEKYINIIVKNPKFKSYISYNIKNEVLILFKEVINLFNSKTENSKFLNFYKRMGENVAKGPKYLAIALIYVILKKKDDTLTQPEITSVINIDNAGVSVTISRFLDILKLIPNYEFTLSFIKPKKLDLHEYSQEIIKYLKIYSKSLPKFYDFKRNFNSELKEILKIFLDSVNSIQKPHKLKEYLNSFSRISPNLHTAIILYIYMKYKKDIDIFMAN